LRRSIETGDGAPTAASYTVFRELSEQLAVQKARLDEALKSDLPAANRMLAERSLAGLAPTTIESKE